MKRKRLCKSLVISFALLLCFIISPLNAQQEGVQPNTDTAVENNESAKEQLFKIKGVLFDAIKNKIPEEKLSDFEEQIKDKELSTGQLEIILSELGFTYDEKTEITTTVEDHLRFVEKIRSIEMVAMPMHSLIEKIKQKEAEEAKVTTDSQKKKISAEIKQLGKQLEKYEADFEASLKGIDDSKLEILETVFEELEFKNNEGDIVFSYVKERIDFVHKMGTLSTIIESIDSLSKQIKTTEKKRNSVKTVEEKQEITVVLQGLNNELSKLNNDFTILVTGIDPSTFEKDDKGAAVAWDKEIKEIFYPIVGELKKVTDKPRRMEKLRGDIVFYEQRLPQINNAIVNIGELKTEITGKKLLERIDGMEEFWKSKETDFKTRLETLKHQLTDEEKGFVSLPEAFSTIVKFFAEDRGKHIIIALITFVGVYFVVYLLKRIFWRIRPFQRSKKSRFWANLIDVLIQLFTFVLALGSTVFVLYISGDWLILGLVIILILGIVWTMRNMLPRFVEQIKLLLNFGTVRQGELVIYDGILWLVESVGIYSYLKNPLLTGGTIRVTLNDLIGMRSRPYNENETLFPSKEGDFVILESQGITVKIVQQTPQRVTIDSFGMKHSMPTSSFLGQKIINLSIAPLWTGTTFYISYKHRYMIDDIMAKLDSAMREGLKAYEHIQDYWVALGELTETSLGFWVWVLLGPEGASAHDNVKYSLPDICLRAANEHKWDVQRFVDINLHSLKMQIPKGEAIP